MASSTMVKAMVQPLIWLRIRSMMLPPKLAATLRFALAAGDTKEVAFESVDIGAQETRSVEWA